jgi:hypothetical protein
VIRARGWGKHPRAGRCEHRTDRQSLAHSSAPSPRDYILIRNSGRRTLAPSSSSKIAKIGIREVKDEQANTHARQG